MGGQYLNYFHQKRKINMVRIKQSGNRLFLYFVREDVNRKMSEKTIIAKFIKTEKSVKRRKVGIYYGRELRNNNYG